MDSAGRNIVNHVISTTPLENKSWWTPDSWTMHMFFNRWTLIARFYQQVLKIQAVKSHTMRSNGSVNCRLAIGELSCLPLEYRMYIHMVKSQLGFMFVPSQRSISVFQGSIRMVWLFQWLRLQLWGCLCKGPVVFGESLACISPSNKQARTTKNSTV